MPPRNKSAYLKAIATRVKGGVKKAAEKNPVRKIVKKVKKKIKDKRTAKAKKLIPARKGKDPAASREPMFRNEKMRRLKGPRHSSKRSNPPGRPGLPRTPKNQKGDKHLEDLNKYGG